MRDILDMLMSYFNNLDELERLQAKYEAEISRVNESIESLHHWIDEFLSKPEEELEGRLAGKPLGEQLEITGKIAEYKLFKQKKKEEHK